jgi:antitoxin HicB
MEIYAFTVHLEPAEEGGYVVTVPDLTGCITQGETCEEALVMAADCIRGFIEALVKTGIEVP